MRFTNLNFFSAIKTVKKAWGFYAVILTEEAQSIKAL